MKNLKTKSIFFFSNILKMFSFNAEMVNAVGIVRLFFNLFGAVRSFYFLDVDETIFGFTFPIKNCSSL